MSYNETRVKELNKALIAAHKDGVLVTSPVSKIIKFECHKQESGKNRLLYRVLLKTGEESVQRLDYIITTLIKKNYCKPSQNYCPQSEVFFEDLFGNTFRQTHLNTIKYNARARETDKRKIPFTVTPRVLERKFKKQKGLCRFTKLPLSFDHKKNPGSVQASLDRIDSSKGYIPGNIQWVAGFVNTMKLALSDKEFIMWCKLIAKNN